MRFQLKEWVVPGIVGAVSFAAGVGSGYFFFRKTAKPQPPPETPLDKKVQKMEETQLKLDFERVERDKEFNFQIQQASHIANDLKAAGQTLLRMIADGYGINKPREEPSTNGSDEVKVYPGEESLVTRVFADDDDDWDYDVEVAKREAFPNKPYIIHRDEYDDDEKDYTKSTLMYYAGDNILCDEHDIPIYNADKIVGKLEFGHGSQDPSIVYVRNDELEGEYEVLLDHGFYQAEILGQQVEHSMKRAAPKPKFKMD